MVEIYKCKYLLPCGYCDKYDIQCKADKEKVVSYPAELYKELKEAFEMHDKNTSTNGCNDENITTSICNHEWYFDSWMFDMNGRKEKHVCRKCGEVSYSATEEVY